jgi:quercetin dioxygenase-like cupin family protein
MSDTPDPSRLLTPTGVHVPAANTVRTLIEAIEGKPLSAPIDLRLGVVTPAMSLVEVHWAKGAKSSPHIHADHDSVVYVVSGHLRVTVGDRTMDAGPGDSLVTPPGVTHFIEALEDSVSIEVKSPPVKTW